MQIAATPAPVTPMVHIPGVINEQPYKAFLAGVDGAREKVASAIQNLIAPPMTASNRPINYRAVALDQAQAALKLLLHARGVEAPEIAQEHNSLAISALQQGVDLLTLPFVGVPVRDIASKFETALRQIDTASAHATVMFAL
jgi:hypothetical protein